MLIQANEILHEDYYNKIKSLPRLYPQYRCFIFPYQLMVGPYIVDPAHWTPRTVPLRQDPIVGVDGASLLPSKEVSLKDFVLEMAGIISRYFRSRLYYFRNFRRTAYFYQIVPFGGSIFRYGVIFPETTINKALGDLMHQRPLCLHIRRV